MRHKLTSLQLYLALVAGGCGVFGVLATLPTLGSAPLLQVFFTFAALSLLRFVLPWRFWLDGFMAALGAWALIASLPAGTMPVHYWLALIAAWGFAWLFVERLSAQIREGKLPETGIGLIIPITFGLALLVMWEVVTRGANVPAVLLPPPSAIGARLAAETGILWADFVQTFIKSVLPGYAIGCLAGLVAAILVDRSPFLKAGIMPIGNFMSALPIIGIAPIMVMWFGFDWQSKAAVVVAMTFFPMLVNTVAGLNAASVMERDLMRTYAASYWQTLFKLRLPAAAPFIFNALKINSTLALIGAIVAEFFGTPVVGMGFRISTGVGRLAIDLVWAEIAVAAVAGSAFYGVIALIERGVTFWHPSVRGGRA
ncbi:ABC transporter permease [Devosia sp. 63-57]|uniref:ABC transporter permease n=1 Tax=Devosia sp. 63-57 TaxID=1895751 RepID=UPI000A5D61C0|nr:ABC transporter permease [Devosia sp. 63-57]